MGVPLARIIAVRARARKKRYARGHEHLRSKCDQKWAPLMRRRRRRLSKLTHFDDAGAAHMVEVGAKPETDREAIAAGTVELEAATLAAIRAGSVAKGDVLGVARLAAIQGVKRTAELIPLG